MLTFDTAGLRARVKADDPANAALDAVDDIDFLEFAGLEESVRADVQFLRENPLVLPETKVTGWVYEVETGKVRFGLFFSGAGRGASRDGSCPWHAGGDSVALTASCRLGRLFDLLVRGMRLSMSAECVSFV